MQGCQLVESHKSAGSGPVRSPEAVPARKQTRKQTKNNKAKTGKPIFQSEAISKMQATPCTKLLTSVRSKTRTKKHKNKVGGRRGTKQHRTRRGHMLSGDRGDVGPRTMQKPSEKRYEEPGHASEAKTYWHKDKARLTETRNHNSFYCSNSSKVELEELATVF